MSEKIVTLSDIHGHGEYIDALQGLYKDKVDKYVIAGDIIYGGNSPARVMEFIKNHNTETILGNHDVYFLAGINGHDKTVCDLIHSTYADFSVESLRRILASYQIDRYEFTKPDALAAIKDKMLQTEHWKIIEGANLYYEDHQSIAVHAGLTRDSWDIQKEQLDKDLQSMRNGDIREPAQVFDDSSKSLSSSESLSDVTDKIVITGHNHRVDHEKRITDDGKRIHIATMLNKGEPLLAWQSWNGELVKVCL